MTWKRALVTTTCLVGAVLLVFAAFGLPIGPSVSLLLDGAVGDKFALSRTAVKTTPLLLTGLGMVVAWRGGMYNIGGEGQLLVGALLGSVLGKVAIQVSLPAPLAVLGILLASIVGGAVWAWIAGWLYVRRGVEVVIGTVLLNFVAIQLLAWAVSGPLQQKVGGLPLTDMLPNRYMLTKFDRQMDLHAGFFLALAAGFAVHGYLFRTRWGYLVRLVGENARMARANRIDSARFRMQAMLVSGALCGLAGGVEYAGMAGQLGSGFSQGWGFLGIPVALLGDLNPISCILSAIFFGALFAGSENLARFTPAGTTLIYAVQALAVLGFVLAQVRFPGTFRWRRAVKPANGSHES